MKTSVAFATASFILTFAATSAHGEDALYGDQPARNAVFVRFVNALDTAVSIKSDLLPPLDIKTEDKDRVSPYQAVDAGKVASLTLTAKANGTEASDKISLRAGTRISIVLRQDGQRLRVTALTARSESSQSRIVLSFMNAAPACGVTSLKLEPSNATIFADVPVDGERWRRINAVSARVGAACSDLGVANVKLERLEAGSAYSLWLLMLHGHPTLILGADTLPTWHP